MFSTRHTFETKIDELEIRQSSVLSSIRIVFWTVIYVATNCRTRENEQNVIAKMTWFNKNIRYDRSLLDKSVLTGQTLESGVDIDEKRNVPCWYKSFNEQNTSIGSLSSHWMTRNHGPARRSWRFVANRHKLFTYADQVVRGVLKRIWNSCYFLD